MSKRVPENELNDAQKKFCHEYVFDWNGRRAYMAAYPSVKKYEVADAAACRLLTNVKVSSYIESLKVKLEQLAGISKLMAVKEAAKLAFSGIAHLHNTWIELSDFEKLTDDQKACIEEISTKIEKKFIPGSSVSIDVEYVKIKLYDKLRAIEILNKMMGWNEPDKIAGTIQTQSEYDLSKLSPAALKELKNAKISGQ